MEQVVPSHGWLLMAAGDSRGHAGNAGYDDQYDAYYSWDSKVPNHKKLQVGDPIALWDKERLLGVSVIEEIETSEGTKLQLRCPACHLTRIQERKNADKRYRCSKCKHEFDTPVTEEVDVTRYTARYDAAWTSLDGLLDKGALKAVNANAHDINAMRPLDWAAFHEALVRKNAERAVQRVNARTLSIDWRPAPEVHADMTHGFGHSLVRVRRGQRQFRERILQHQGSVCAFTGAAPERVLEAGHLYSYAQLGTHFEYGGLMLRRDIHRLFDDGMLSVEPTKLRVDVAPDLAAYPQYARLHQERLTVPLQPQQVDWLGKHWKEHREAHLSR